MEIQETQAAKFLTQRIELLRELDRKEHEHKVWKKKQILAMGTLLNQHTMHQEKVSILKKQVEQIEAEEKKKKVNAIMKNG